MTNFSGENLNIGACADGPQGERRDSASNKYQSYPEYKDSGVEWLGEIPKKWTIKKIKWEITASSGTDQKSEDGIFELYGANGIIGKSNSSSINHKQGVVLVGRVGSAGSINYVQDVCAVSDNALIIKNAFSSVPRFDFYLLLSLNLEELVSKNAQPLITASNIRDVFAAVPFHDTERMEIANFLDHETAKIDTLIEQQQKLIQLLKEKRQAVISHAVTKGLNPDAPMKDSGVEWLGEVPEGWDVKPLKYICDLIDGDRSSAYPNDKDLVESGIPFLSSKNIVNYKFTTENLSYISLEKFNSLGRGKLKHNDLVITVRGTIGHVGVFDKEIIGSETGFINAQMMIMRPRRSITTYLQFVSESTLWKEQLDIAAYGSTVKQLSNEVLANVIVVMPPLADIPYLVSLLNEEFLKYQSLIDKATNAVRLMQERRTALISAAVTGKIDVRGWQTPTAN